LVEPAPAAINYTEAKSTKNTAEKSIVLQRVSTSAPSTIIRLDDVFKKMDQVDGDGMMW